MDTIDTELPRAKKKPDPPHWSTYITPVASLVIAGSALFIAWETQDVNKKVNRPIINVLFKEKHPFSVTGTSGTFTIKNSGNSPAYHLVLTFPDSDIESIVAEVQGSGSLGPHDSIEQAAVLSPKQGHAPAGLDNARSFVVISAHATYGDSYGHRYVEPFVFIVDKDKSITK